ncbi:hypothetical protein C8Q80DRAFT_1178525 [Daedaleopsis nitida]|nr:hypothetical protein C8Q80DRAFT_1178525 [Daedaleopsis nitida]
MSSSPAQLQLSPSRSPSLSSVFSRSPPRDTPATPPTAFARSPHAPPTPPDSSSRAVQHVALSPLSNSSPDTSSDLSLSTALSASDAQFQSRLLDTPIDIHCLAPELDSPGALQDSVVSVERDTLSVLKQREHASPTPTQEEVSRKLSADSLPPPFVPAAARVQPIYERQEETPEPSPAPDSRPPNIYINGLPPNFPEEELLNMTRPFGTVLSVRTFTRHVSDKPSGYGFVLFETLDAAEKCIVSLRKYRNLHPSFSKQVHKIPGTDYASVPTTLTTHAGPVDSFKSKMEQLGDTGSTNLYMEGLPLSITDETLRALVTPYRIMSSRFFHTRLSSPPRIIAFVRLESRTAAEDIVERLHGRLVRGWNDAGCRISVRFADTAEQRELRRTERHGREGEQSPARLTMARAALLNLKGTQCQSAAQSPTLTDINLGSLPNSNIGLALNSLGFGQLGAQVSPLSATSPLPVQDPSLRAALSPQEFSALGVDSFDALSARSSQIPGQGLRIPQNSVGNGGGVLDSELQLALMGMQGLRSGTLNGYTPVEQLILQAHARQQRAGTLAAHSGDAQSGLQNLQGNLGRTPSSSGQDINRRLLDFLPQMSEDEFHATAGLQHSLGLNPGDGERVPSLALDMERHMSISGQQARQRNHTLAAQARSEGDDPTLHVRSSTLPSQYLSIRSNTSNIPIYDSNISLGSNAHHNTLRSTNTDVSCSKNRSSLSMGNSTRSRNTSTSNTSSAPLPDTQTLFSSKNNINVPSAASRITMKPMTTSTTATSLPPSSGANMSKLGRNTRLAGHVAGASHAGAMRVPDTHQEADDEDDESPVVSPALTYSARTPASLSPATPYSGFFADGGETFKGHGVGVVGGGELRFDGGVGEKAKGTPDMASQ